MTGGGVATLRKQQQDSPELELCEGEGEAVIPFSQPHSRSQAWDWLQRERLCVEGTAACKDTHSLGTGRWNGVPSRFLPDFCLWFLWWSILLYKFPPSTILHPWKGCSIPLFLVGEDFCEPMWVEGGEEIGKGLKAHGRGFYCDTSLHRTFSEIRGVSVFHTYCIVKWSEVKSLSRIRLLATPWTAAYQAPPSMGFSRQEYWSGVPLPYIRWSKLCFLVILR